MLVRTASGSDRAQRETLRALGLRKIGSTSTRPDNPATRGMIDRVAHLVTVEEAGVGTSRLA